MWCLCATTASTRPSPPQPSPDCAHVMAQLGSDGFCRRRSEGSFEDIQTISNILPHSFMLQWCRKCCPFPIQHGRCRVRSLNTALSHCCRCFSFPGFPRISTSSCLTQPPLKAERRINISDSLERLGIPPLSAWPPWTCLPGFHSSPWAQLLVSLLHAWPLCPPHDSSQSGVTEAWAAEPPQDPIPHSQPVSHFLSSNLTFQLPFFIYLWFSLYLHRGFCSTAFSCSPVGAGRSATSGFSSKWRGVKTLHKHMGLNLPSVQHSASPCGDDLTCICWKSKPCCCDHLGFLFSQANNIISQENKSIWKKKNPLFFPHHLKLAPF